MSVSRIQGGKLMKRVSILASLVVVIIIAAVLFNQRSNVLSQREVTGSQEANPTPGIAYTDEVGTVMPASPMPVPPTIPVVEEPTSTPIPAAPQPEPGLASDQVIYTFDAPDLTDWHFGQVFPDVAGAPVWSVEDGNLRAANHENSIYMLNDVLAVPPESLQGDGAVEVSALTTAATRIGLLLGYQDDQNYVTAIYGPTGTSPREGVTILQMVAGEPTVLAASPETVLQTDTWYNLRFEMQGSTVTASLDGAPVLSAELEQPLAGQQIGLYAGSEGTGFFDNLRIMDS
jgi:hypothetical protein